ncbi:MAG: adaptor protein MecA [Eubacteriales bacterium]|nr:adaptor protein MecA [Eubacteriales bacterium]
MKIEKLNDNQIRCTLTREDLASRHLNLLELAYGGEKAKSLFREMMQQAAYEFGFEANDIPIMIEAIPVSSDSLILIITKVDDPEELDTRFAKFAPGGENASDGESSFSSLKLEGADDILNLFKKIREAHKALTQKPDDAEQEQGAAGEEEPGVSVTKLYRFASLDDVIRTARILNGSYQGENSLYKHPQTQDYHLFLCSSQHTPEEFNRICNTVSEYGDALKYSSGALAYLKEHGTPIVLSDALQRLVTI